MNNNNNKNNEMATPGTELAIVTAGPREARTASGARSLVSVSSLRNSGLPAGTRCTKLLCLSFAAMVLWAGSAGSAVADAGTPDEDAPEIIAAAATRADPEPPMATARFDAVRPDPGALAMLGFGLIGLAVGIRRTSRRR